MARLKLKQNWISGCYALGSSYIALPWLAGQCTFGSVTPEIIALTLWYSVAAVGIAIVNDFKSVEGSEVGWTNRTMIGSWTNRTMKTEPKTESNPAVYKTKHFQNNTRKSWTMFVENNQNIGDVFDKKAWVFVDQKNTMQEIESWAYHQRQWSSALILPSTWRQRLKTRSSWPLSPTCCILVSGPMLWVCFAWFYPRSILPKLCL